MIYTPPFGLASIRRFAAMSLPPSTTSTRSTEVTSTPGLPAVAHEVLHRELLHLHSSLHLILLILRGPFDSVTPSVVDTVTCPRLSANLRALETCLEQIRRSTCTTLVYANELCSALAIPHLPGQSAPTTSPTPRSSLVFLHSPPSPPGTTTGTTTTAPISTIPPTSPPTLIFSDSPTTLPRMPRSPSPSRSRSPPRRFRF